MSNEKNIGERFKESLKDYDSPFDAEKMFGAIEADLPKEEGKRRFGLLWLGCGSLVGVISLLAVLYLITNFNSQTDLDQQEAVAAKLANIEQSSIKKHPVKEPFIAKSTEHIANSELVNSSSKASNIVKKQHLESSSLVDINSITDSFTNEQELNQRPKNIEAIKHQIDGSEVTNKIDNFKVVQINPIHTPFLMPHLRNLELLEKKLEIKDSIQIVANASPPRKKFELSITVGTTLPFKNSKYIGINHDQWFNNYQEGQTLIMGLSASAELNYFFNENAFASLSLNYLGHQEKHLFNTSTTDTYFDADLPKTIYVNRDGEVLDTEFGVDVTSQSDSTFSLITNINLIGIGLGVGKRFIWSGNLYLDGQLHFTPYLIQHIEGKIIDPDANLNSIESLSIDNTKGSLNRLNMNIQASLSIKYRLNQAVDFGLRTSYRYHINDFSTLPTFSQRRSYLEFGLVLTRKF